MAKVTVYRKIITGIAAMLLYCSLSQAQYTLHLLPVDPSAALLSDSLLKKKFDNRQQCEVYINKLPSFLQTKGYPYASVDSVRYDSLAAYCELFAGEKLRHTYLDMDSVETPVLENINWNRRSKKPLSFEQFHGIQENILGYLENAGYPFASVEVDSVHFVNDSMYARLKIEKGPRYKIDSIRNFGTASISSGFLQQYLGIRNGSYYRKQKLQEISGRLRELPFLQEKQPWNLTMLGTGSILNLYMDTKKSSEVNVLIGLLPANAQLPDNKMLVTGEANIHLKNSLGGGETIGLNWQQIQVKSPRLDILFEQPYLFGSPFGMNFNFNLFKKDTSFVNVALQVGAAYAVSSRQTGSVFIQRLTTNLLTIDTFAVKSSHRLPAEADVSSVNLGVNYEWYNTDYRFNPRKGTEMTVSASAGTKTIRENNVILKLTDVSDPAFHFGSLYDTFQLKSYQFRVKLNAAHYFPLTRASALKVGLNGGWFQSPNIFRNEMFQIGGYKLLRGFDEESIFASVYGVGTLEYRYLLGQNSFLSAFMDYGSVANRSSGRDLRNHFLGAGLGMSFETKAGIFNISYAAGKRDDAKFNLRQSKIHLGYVNYF